jgi:transcriptional regulator with XRE-family HTH domain
VNSGIGPGDLFQKGNGCVVPQRSDDFAAVAGTIFRQLRASRGISLRQVNVLSDGLFKPSTIASYERGDRQISLERLFALADVYEVAPERIVAAIAARLEPPSVVGERDDEPVILDRLGLGPPQSR